MTKYDYISRITELEQQGKWEKIKEITFHRYDQMKEVVGRFTKTEITGYTYRKL